MSSQNRMKVAVAGAGGSIGSEVCRSLAEEYDVVALVGARERLPESETRTSISWVACEPFSRQDVQRAIVGCDYIIYLVHTRLPTARLDQAESENMDLLIADNVARAASSNGVKQIIYLGFLSPKGDLAPEIWERRNEVITALSVYGTPLTVLRAGLVVSPGSSAVQLLVNLATRLPVVFIPSWADNLQQPVGVTDVSRAIRYCLGNQQTMADDYDIGGPLVLSLKEVLQRTAVALQAKQRVVILPFFPKRLFALYLRLLNRQAHPALISLTAEILSHDAIVRDNPVQHYIAVDAVQPREVIEPYVKKWGRLPSNPRQPFIKTYLAGLHAKSNVRSIQRIALRPGRNAAWVADTFFQWLPRFARPFVRCEVDKDGTCRIFNRLPRLNLLILSFQPDRSSPDRRMYYITGGLLARGHDQLQPRFEFRDVLDGRYTIAAIHDFRPQLPWGFYNLTQAVIHLIAMRRFQKYMEKKME